MNAKPASISLVSIKHAFGVEPEFILFPNGFQRKDLEPKLKQIRDRLKRFDKAS